ncbi:enhanced serine sensitivity protein SseB C-terminal domain-containing protein [Actinoplanes sp. URMC 104]|uniref:enhanced serine sensitivity protein SseB C-terminal domain-containing protein n=1 Tax=Actinoplanes sp. URMC 104 TaxID=3423409 RepID=UPI003F1BBA15
MAAEFDLVVNTGADLGMRSVRTRCAPSAARRRCGLAPGYDPASHEPEPCELIDALRAEFTRVPAVVEARRAFSRIGGQPPSLQIGVLADRDVSGWQQDCVAAVQTATGQAPLPYPVDTVFLDDPTDPMTRWMLEHTEPYFEPGAAAP